MITSNFDILIAIILMIFSFLGLVRGFLKEISSIANWFGSFYFTSIIKPYIRPFFESKIQIPFLLDMVVNIVVFVGLIIVISIITNYLSVLLKKIVPSSLNGNLGFLFGLLKGILITLVLIAFLKIAYNKKVPDYLENSFIYNSISNDDIFVDMLNSIFGDFAKTDIKEEVNKQINNKVNELVEEKINDKMKEIKNNFDEKKVIEDRNLEDNFKENIEKTKDNIQKIENNITNNVNIEKFNTKNIKKIEQDFDNENLDKLIDIIAE